MPWVLAGVRSLRHMLSISTSDGVAEAIVATPPRGTGPGVLFFMDAFGLRPRIEEMAAQIASWGYVVLVPNVFYRDGTVSELAPQGDLTTPAGREAFWQVAGARIEHLTTEMVVRDNDAYPCSLSEQMVEIGDSSGDRSRATTGIEIPVTSERSWLDVAEIRMSPSMRRSARLWM